ncbi:MBL fold metallo-hydrolase [Defluviimonas salinarum]|uniref:MBL fold metallo-hydrolase n=1 Tax=Defluviimonas salinarum TaxID=2992147 RepID=A0ABT3JAK4_9RHOB|nr:MBL fold metallo-hydrolase [Defluviimonas salinarum]MCW3784730.1 MBL fold metallo-hydrolase [Defluviimonas salinarum]
MPFPIADRWFEKKRINDDITLIYEPYVVPFLRCNIWHIRGRDRDLMIDTGTGLDSLSRFARHILGQKVTAVATHVHMDHIGCHHEFDHCLVHELEADGLRNPRAELTLVGDCFDPNDIASLYLPGIDDPGLDGPMVTALPHAGFDLRTYRLRAASGVSCIGEGDVVDIGSRAFEVLHLPGHSPGSVGLWEAETGTLFSGDAVYDGPLIDDLHHSERDTYEATLRRLRDLPVNTVHAGHDPSFGRERLHQIIDEQLQKWDSVNR